MSAIKEFYGGTFLTGNENELYYESGKIELKYYKIISNILTKKNKNRKFGIEVVKKCVCNNVVSEEKKEILGYIGLLDDDKLKNLVWEVLSPINSNMIVTTKEIDFVVDKLGLLISECLNDCLHKIEIN